MKTEFNIDDIVQVDGKIVEIFIDKGKEVRYKVQFSNGATVYFYERSMVRVDEQQT